METQDSDFEFETAESTPLRKAFGMFLGAGLLCFAFVPLGAALGWCGFEPGARAFSPSFLSRLPLLLMGYWLALHVLLVWPMTYLVFSSEGTLSRSWLGPAVASLLVALPLASYGYYLGNFRVETDYRELLLIVVPASALSVLAFYLSRRTWLASWLLALTTFIPFFLINDILGPFSVAWSYVPHQPGFYTLRQLFPVISLGTVGYLLRTMNHRAGVTV